LAYPIKKSSKGKYSNIYIEGNNKVIKEIELFERYDERVMKFLSIKIKKIPEESSELVKTA
jgi:small subunit ribosomal protein S6